MLQDQITPPLSAARAHEIATAFDLRALPADFLANPYPVYAALREHDTGTSALVFTASGAAS